MAVAEAKARILAMMVVVINFILCFFVCVFVVSEFVDTLVQDAIILASLEMCEASKHIKCRVQMDKGKGRLAKQPNNDIRCHKMKLK